MIEWEKHWHYVWEFSRKNVFQMIFSHCAFAGSAKDGPIVTPLMDFVRQKRSTKGGSRVSFYSIRDKFDRIKQ